MSSRDISHYRRSGSRLPFSTMSLRLFQLPRRCPPCWHTQSFPQGHTIQTFASIRRFLSSQTQSIVPVQKSLVEKLPPKMRPYLYLSRIDKPIGTLLLFYPCSMSCFSSFPSTIPTSPLCRQLGPFRWLHTPFKCPTLYH